MSAAGTRSRWQTCGRSRQSLGHTEIATYIQSGNLVFTSDDEDAIGLADALEQEIARSLGVRPAVVVLSRADIAQVIADNPFPEESNPKALHAVFHRDPITDETDRGGRRR